VIHNAIAAGVDSATAAETCTPVAELRAPAEHPYPYAALSVEATCACNKRFVLDLVKVSNGEPQEPKERRWAPMGGVSWKRRTHSAE
jgi:hypothetical protein